jgi:hypothetical protein
MRASQACDLASYTSPRARDGSLTGGWLSFSTRVPWSGLREQFGEERATYVVGRGYGLRGLKRDVSLSEPYHYFPRTV